MRIYNSKDSSINLPLGNGQRIVVEPKSLSIDFLPNVNFLNTLVTSYGYDEIALVISGAIELNLCSSVSCANGFVAHSVSEAVERFSKKPEVVEVKSESCVPGTDWNGYESCAGEPECKNEVSVDENPGVEEKPVEEVVETKTTSIPVNPANMTEEKVENDKKEVKEQLARQLRRRK